MKKLLLLQMMCAVIFAVGQSTMASAQAQDKVQDLNDQSEPPKLGIHWSRDFDPSPRATNEAKAAHTNKSANMTYHGGKIMTTAVTQTIFWGTSWGSYSGDEITGMDTWYQGFNQSHYAGTSDEYSGSNGKVGSTTAHLGHLMH